MMSREGIKDLDAGSRQGCAQARSELDRGRQAVENKMMGSTDGWANGKKREASMGLCDMEERGGQGGRG